MELEWMQRDCEYLRSNVRQVQNLEQTQEVRLSEGMPDIGRVLCVWGHTLVRSKQWHPEGVTVSGSMELSVLYAPEDGTEPRSVAVSLPFSGRWSFAESQREGAAVVTAQLCSADARALSARKLMVRGNAGVQLQAWERTKAAFYSPGQLPQDVQLLQKTYPAMLPREAGEKQFGVEETLHLPSEPRKLLTCTMQPVVTEQTAAAGRVVFRGECRVHAVYMDQDEQLCSADVALPFAQLAELDRDYDKDALAQVLPALVSGEVTLTDGVAQLQCTLAGQYVIYDRCLVEVAEDAYSPFMPVEPHWETLELPMLLEQRQEEVPLQVQWEAEAARVVDAWAFTMQPTVYRDGDTASVELPGQMQVLYYDGEGKLHCDSRSWNGALQLPVGQNGAVAAELLQLRPCTTMQMGQQLGVEGGAALALTTAARQQIPMIAALTVGQRQAPDPMRPTLILQRMGEAGLWELAKLCGSTVEAIEQANGLQQEPKPGQMLLIPVL